MRIETYIAEIQTLNQILKEKNNEIQAQQLELLSLNQDIYELKEEIRELQFINYQLYKEKGGQLFE